MKTSIESVAVIGAGALGLLYADALSHVLGDGVFFLAGQERRTKISETVYGINGRDARFRAVSQPDMGVKPDLVIVAVKNHHLESIVPLLEAAVGEETVVISVLNGISSEEFIRRHAPAARLLYCVALGMDAVKEGDSLRFTNPGRLLVGTEDNNAHDPCLRLLTDLFRRCGIAYEVPRDIIRSLWWKWMINIGVNQVSAVTGAVYGLFMQVEELKSLMDDAMKETVEVARAEEVDLTEQDIREWYTVLNGLGAAGKTSMLQDVEAKRKGEVDAFSGALIEIARRHAIPVPVNETLFRIVKAIEATY
jgi:2-dehydropantoate 2-reductase